jgi:hypothetical protein
MEIIVEGKGSSFFTPNEVNLNLKFYFKGYSYEEVLREGSKNVLDFVNNLLLKQGFQKEDMKTRNFVIKEDTRYNEITRKHDFDGYSYNQSAILKFDYVKEKVTSIMEEVSKLNNPPYCNIEFGIKNAKECKKEVLSKAYLDAYGKNSVRKLVFVGTPHLGSPQAGKMIIEGENYKIPWLSPTVFESLASNYPSVHQLLPHPIYFDSYQGYIKPYGLTDKNKPLLNYEETKGFFLDTNNKNPKMFEKAESFFAKNLPDFDFTGIDTYNIVSCKNPTPSVYDLAFGNDSFGYIVRASGDGTVPFVSANYINIANSHKYYTKNIDHGEMPSADGIRGLILGILKEDINLENNVSIDSSVCYFKGKSLSWHSPVEVHIYDQSGNHTGPIANNGIEYGIPGVDYEVSGHNKFIFLPTDEGQQYQVVAKGLDLGTFDLRISEIDNGQYLTTQIFNDVPVNTTTSVSLLVTNVSQDNALEVIQDGQAIQVNASASLEGEGALDLIPPVTAASTTGAVGENGWYKSDVSLSLTAADEGVGVLNTYYKLDSDGTYKTYVGPIGLIGEGLHTISYYSVDKAGNNEEIKETEVKIDKTSPEFAVQFSVQTKDFTFKTTEDLPLDCGNGECIAKDQAGNESVLKFNKTQALLWHFVRLEIHKL